MFTSSYFADRYWAPWYWPKVGSDVVLVTGPGWLDAGVVYVAGLDAGDVYV